MATSGRDLQVKILSDTSGFDLEQPAKQLTDLADGADKADRPLKDLGDTADRTARDVDDLQRTIAAASQELKRLGDGGSASGSTRGFRKISEETDHTKEKLHEFRDEAKATSFEAAQSFSGSSGDIVDSLQEIAGEALPALGPAAAAAGFAAAVGIGYLFNKAQQTKEKIQDLTQTLIDDGGRLSTDSLFARLGDEAVAGRLAGMVRTTQQLGVSSSNLATIFGGNNQAMANLRAGAVQVTNSLRDQARQFRTASANTEGYSAQLTKGQRAILERYDAGRKLIKTIDQEAGVSAQARRQANALRSVFGVSVQTMQNYADALSTVGDTSDEFARKSRRNASSIIRDQERHIRALERLQANAQEVYDKVGQAGVDWALSQKNDVAGAMEFMANLPRRKAGEIAGNYQALGNIQRDALAHGFNPVHGDLTSTLQDTINDMRRLAGQSPIKVQVHADTSAARAQVQGFLSDFTNSVIPFSVRRRP